MVSSAFSPVHLANSYSFFRAPLSYSSSVFFLTLPSKVSTLLAHIPAWVTVIAGLSPQLDCECLKEREFITSVFLVLAIWKAISKTC